MEAAAAGIWVESVERRIVFAFMNRKEITRVSRLIYIYRQRGEASTMFRYPKFTSKRGARDANISRVL